MSAPGIEGATAPSSVTVEDENVTSPNVVNRENVGGPSGVLPCQVCGRSFGSQRGLSLHQRMKHPEWFHGVRIADVSRSGWSTDEMIVVAREEIRLVEAGKMVQGPNVKIRVNFDLFRKFPERTADAIKGLRKSEKYKNLRERLMSGASPVEFPIEYEKPWLSRIGLVAGGLPPRPTQETSQSQRVVGGDPSGPTQEGVESQRRVRVNPVQWCTPEKRDRTGLKVRWSEELLLRMAETEDRLVTAGTRTINQDLAKAFPERSFDAIKKMRQSPKYRALLRGRKGPVAHPAGRPSGHPQQEVERGSMTPSAKLIVSLPMTSPVSPEEMSTRDVVTPERPSNEEHVSRILSPDLSPGPSCTPRPEDVSPKVGEDGGKSATEMRGDNLDEYSLNVTNQSDIEFELWIEDLQHELILTQGYLVGLDSTEFLDFRPDNLSKANKDNIDKEYKDWVDHELRVSGARKGPRRRARRRQAALRKETTRKEVEPAAVMGRRRRRRTEYARIQKLYRTNRTECARKVLTGEWRTSVTPTIPLDDQVTFWKKVFGEKSLADDRIIEPQGKILWDLVRPVRLEEIYATLRKTKEGAAGLDRISREEVRKLDPRALLAHFNLWLYAGYQPKEFRHSRTVLIPKVEVPSGPGQYRPIAISAFVARVFHRLLAGRMSGLLEFQSRQRAFIKGDGIADNVFLLRCILRDRCKELKPLSLAFLDVSKAFDTVSHSSLLLAVKRMGVPGPFISYLHSLYSETSTSLHVDGQFSSPLEQNRGVKQGDPLSPLLFNCVIDWALASLETEMGVVVGKDGPRLNHLAFADDIVLIAESKIGIQHLCWQVQRALGHCGLALNADKSRTLRIAVNGKAKQWLCDPIPFLSLAGGILPAVPVSHGYKYLGIRISARERDSTPEELLTRGINQITRAPLKPQQRIYILCNHLINKLFHRLVLSRSNGAVLRRLDKLVRRGLRAWLKLPHDTTNSYIHADAKDGGLGIPALKIAVPLMKEARLARLARVKDPTIQALVASSHTFAEEVQRCHHPPIRVGSSVIANREEAREAWASSLYESADGYGLKASPAVPFIHGWVRDGTRLMTGAGFIHAVQIRGATVSTAKRAARGRPLATDKCDACGRTETLGHVLQVCHRTWGTRIKRHDALMEKFLHGMENRGWLVMRAPVILVVGGTPQKPDGILYARGRCWVIDASVVADNADLDEAHRSKCAKYDTPAVRDWCQSHWPSPEVPAGVSFGALIFNWRGAMSPLSARMCRALGCNQSDMKLMSVSILEWGWKLFRAFHQSTAVWQ
ncbi:hypothetical protein DJ031_00280 [bacterium endosymbiont of Escarpia laminata]|nr:MAG: hypothetical protein DJ031_00280 [bacterium endosymbiont of Escarpia laminata]